MDMSPNLLTCNCVFKLTLSMPLSVPPRLTSVFGTASCVFIHFLLVKITTKMIDIKINKIGNR